MTPDLIALVLRQPLLVRLALLDANPTGAGWLIHAEGRKELLPAPPVQSWTFPDGARGAVGEGFAWLPCNPDAIKAHALKLADGHYVESLTDIRSAMLRMVFRHDDPRASDPMASFKSRVGTCVENHGPDFAMIAAVRLLAEVVGHE
jgi:hypothetical protein